MSCKKLRKHENDLTGAKRKHMVMPKDNHFFLSLFVFFSEERNCVGKEGNCLSNSRFGEKSRNAQPSEEALRDLLRDECEPDNSEKEGKSEGRWKEWIEKVSRRDKLSNHKDVESWFAYSGKFEFSLIPCDHYLCSDRPFCKLNFGLSLRKNKRNALCMWKEWISLYGFVKF